ncbi:MAG TPA: TetR/AcrR family transcriptional regulator [Burkholderiales bacterium]|nr:TetR/AcrR family transcriptional regulator [Burkholderiales bacterium]
MTKPTQPDVRQRILDAALALLAEHGFMEVSQPKVAKAAGVRQSHLTYYFPTRSDLLKAVAVYSIESMLGAIAAKAGGGKMTPEAFAQFAAETLADKRRARVMLGLIVSSDEDPEIKQFLREFVARVRTAMAGIASMLGRGADETHIAALHMLFVGATVLNVARDDANSRRECAEIARLAVDTFLPGGVTVAPKRPAARKPS